MNKRNLRHQWVVDDTEDTVVDYSEEETIIASKREVAMWQLSHWLKQKLKLRRGKEFESFCLELALLSTAMVLVLMIAKH